MENFLVQPGALPQRQTRQQVAIERMASSGGGALQLGQQGRRARGLRACGKNVQQAIQLGGVGALIEADGQASREQRPQVEAGRLANAFDLAKDDHPARIGIVIRPA